MSDLLKLTKHDHAAVIRQIAELLLKANPIDLDEITVIPTAMVAQCTGLSPKSVQRKFPITMISTQKQGVLLKTLREYMAKNTRPPAV
jgi:hypothetical protein